VVATQNPGKLREIRAILTGTRIALRSLADFPDVVLPDEGDDYTANAVAKARAVAEATGRAALGDDSGLEVDALDGRPGVRSARYGGPGLDDVGRASRLLLELDACGDVARTARFVCVAALASPDGAVETARGVCAGTILREPSGHGGFGYDPIFQPAGERAAMAELPEQRKNQLSHRAAAIAALRAAIERVGAPTSFLLIRHAESVWNAEDRWQGHADPPLSARGIAQAEALGHSLAVERVDALISSDLTRARQTAEILGRALGLAPRCDPRLRELDVGRWAGLTRGEIEACDADALKRFEAEDPDLCAGGGESRTQIRTRVRRAFRALAEEFPGARVIVVTHLGVVRALVPGAELGHAALASITSAQMPVTE
jgi:XTP/dITP diphosphohydrolase